jgi:5-methyltetrahydrofolate--homocysteine methyltransferase
MKISEFKSLATKRVLVLDGAMGTMIQTRSLSDDDFSGVSSEATPIPGFTTTVPQKGNNDILCLTRPDVIADIHRNYINAGADIISTCTFNANEISQRDYATESLCYEINRRGAEIARSVANDAASKGRQVLVAGSIGPTNKTASMSPDINNPALRDVDFDQLFNAYSQQVEGLLDGGADILLFETAFDTINLKAGLNAAASVIDKRGVETPIMVSLTLSSGGRSLSGQSIPAFVTSIANAPYLVSIGMNCSFGPKQMFPYLQEISRLSPSLVSAHPNAGLPDEFGNYAETPEIMAETIKRFLDLRLVNIIGGCCGTTPDHIRRIAELAASATPHQLLDLRDNKTLYLSGIDELQVKQENNFLSIGERCNVAGSRKFLRLIKEKNYEEAVEIARKQVHDGAQVLDINMDDGMLDAKNEMRNFLNLLMSDPDIAAAPIMIDSSNFETIIAALKCVQGKSIVNSISLKNGEEEFINHASIIRRMGAAVVVMAFDENGQATTFNRKISICQRAYKILTEKVGFLPGDIIFDPNILTIATGIEEHNAFALDYIRAVKWIKQNLPGAKVSGGVSNLSFAFRGNNYIREAMHAVFLYHAINAGLDMAIINPATSVTFSDIPDQLRTVMEDLILNRRPDAADELTELAQAYIATDKSQKKVSVDRSQLSLDSRLQDAIVHGSVEFLETDLSEALNSYPSAISIIEGPLLEGMNKVGNLFGAGKMFLPQVVKSARTMNRAVDILRPAIDAANAQGNKSKAGTVVIATVKGDVHDIGKNIVSIVLRCNNYEVIDLGVMVPAADIVAKVREVNADILCLSGLITPSLAEMTKVAQEMELAGLSIPIFVGGATTSQLHTAVKIAPYYSGPVLHISDAARNPIAAAKLLNAETHDQLVAELNETYNRLRSEHERKEVNIVPISDARSQRFSSDYVAPKPLTPGRSVIDIPVSEVVKFINWRYFFNAWNLSETNRSCNCPTHNHEAKVEAEKLKADALNLVGLLSNDSLTHIRAIVGLYNAASENDDIIIDNDLLFPTLRRQQSGADGYLSIADYLQPKSSGNVDYIGLFALSAGLNMSGYYAEYEANGDSYARLLLQSVSDRLAEASAEWLHHYVRTSLWGYAPHENLSVEEMWQNKHQGIRPAVGYPSIPDQTLMHLLNDKLNLAEIGISVTENGALDPTASISGLYIANPNAQYFSIGKIGDDQLKDYADRRSLTVENLKSLLRL